MKKYIPVLLLLLFALLAPVAQVHAGKNNNFSQGGKWNRQENNQCGAGCRDWDPTFGGSYNTGGARSSYYDSLTKILQSDTAIDPGIIAFWEMRQSIEIVNTRTGIVGGWFFDAAGDQQMSGYYKAGSTTQTVEQYNDRLRIWELVTKEMPVYKAIGVPVAPAGGGDGGGGGGDGPVPTSTPAPAGLIQARAVTIDHVPLTCNDVKTAPDRAMRSGTKFSLKRGNETYGPLTQDNDQYVQFQVPPATYTLSPEASTTNSIRVCLTDNAGGEHFGDLSVTMYGGDGAIFDVAYGPLGPWFQTKGADVYAAGTILSAVGSSSSPRLFNLQDGSVRWTDGVVTYAGQSGSYDFDPDTGKGESYVSPENRLVNDSPYATMNLYDYFYSRLGSPETADVLENPLSQPQSRETAYYLVGDYTTSGDWLVGNGQNLIFLIDGSLTIAGKINVAGDGFVAFFVKNNITISDSVGVAFNSTTPVVEGVYSTNATFRTGTSSVAGKERFVGKGLFLADNVVLSRDFQAINQNGNEAAELFIYNPSFVWQMPDEIMDTGVSWREEAP